MAKIYRVIQIKLNQLVKENVHMIISIRITGIGLGFRKRGFVLVQDLGLFAVTAARNGH